MTFTPRAAFRCRPGWRAAAAGLAAACGVLAGCSGTPAVAPAASEHAPAPALSRFVPSSQQVLHVAQFRLDGRGVPEVAVTSAAVQVSGTPYPPEDLRLLAWDRYARRWLVVFNAATYRTYVSYEADAPMGSGSLLGSAPGSGSPLLPPSAGASGVHVAAIHDRPGGRADLLVWANLQYADGPALTAAIISYNGLTARVTWTFASPEPGSVSVIGAAPRQRIEVATDWVPPVDPHCCPAGPYRFTVARIRGLSATGQPYQAVSDTRPWLGAFISYPQSATSATPAEVISVIPGSPAAGVLRPLDLLTGIAGASPGSAVLGPAVAGELASRHAGQVIRLDIIRHGAPMTVTLRLASRASPRAIAAAQDFPAPSYIGVAIATLTVQRARQNNLPETPGAWIIRTLPGGPAQQAGLTAGDVITAFDNVIVRSATGLQMAIAVVRPGTAVPVTYITPAGVTATAQVTAGTAPAQYASQILML